MKRSQIKLHARSPEETERIYGSPERREWMTRQHCVICGARPSVGAHVRSGGMSRKDDASRQVPMCQTHHDEYDGRLLPGGKKTFMAKYDLTADGMLGLADWVESRWQEYRAVERASW